MKELAEDKQFLDSFAEICAHMGTILDIDKVAAYFVNKLSELLNVKRISFMLLDKVKGELSIKASRGLDPTMGKARVKLGEAFSGWVAKEGNPLIVKDVGEEFPELAKNRAARYLTKSFIISIAFSSLEANYRPESKFLGGYTRNYRLSMLF